MPCPQIRKKDTKIIGVIIQVHANVVTSRANINNIGLSKYEICSSTVWLLEEKIFLFIPRLYRKYYT